MLNIACGFWVKYNVFSTYMGDHIHVSAGKMLLSKIGCMFVI